MWTVPLVPVDPAILSSYGADGKTGGARTGLTPLARLGKAGIAPAPVGVALLALHRAVGAAGGDFRVTELHRDVAVQTAARAKYDRWVAAGKPKPGDANWSGATMKTAFVAAPGKSNHNGGRAIDIHTSLLAFPGVTKDKQLDVLWGIARPLGWTPIIKAPNEGESEAWHFDYWGELQGVYDRLGYEQAALAGALLVGHAGPWQSYARVLQALLQRAGYAIGEIDGQPGAKTIGALAKALQSAEVYARTKIEQKDESIFPILYALSPK